MAAFGIPSLSPELEATIAAGLSETESLLNSRIEGRYLFANETSRHLVAAGGKRFRPLITILGSLIGSGINSTGFGVSGTIDFYGLLSTSTYGGCNSFSFVCLSFLLVSQINSVAQFPDQTAQ